MNTHSCLFHFQKWLTIKSRKGYGHTLLTWQQQPAILTDSVITCLLCTSVAVSEIFFFDSSCQCLLLSISLNACDSFSNVSIPGRQWTVVLTGDELWWLPYNLPHIWWVPNAYVVLALCNNVPIWQIGKLRLTGNLHRVTELQNDRTGFNFAHTTYHLFKHKYLYFLQFLCFYICPKNTYTYFSWQCYCCYYYLF